MNTSLPVMQSLWVGGQLSNLEILCLKSFVDHGHPFHLYTYEEMDNVPSGVVQMDARDILPESRIFKCADRDTYSGFADIFRYKLLLDKGGIWTDMDIVCLRPFDITDEYVLTVEKSGNITNFFMRAPKGSELMRKSYGETAGLDPKNTLWAQTGPMFFASVVKTLDIDPFVLGWQSFSPIPYFRHKVFTNENTVGLIETELKDSFGVHLWNEMWRIEKVDKNKVYSPTSIYGALQDRHGLA